MHWRFLSDAGLDAAMNMAIDEAIALSFPKKNLPTLRLYQWACPTLTIGAFQKLDPLLLSTLDKHQIAWIRRITGGKALLHDRDITYSVVASTGDALFSDGIKKTFFSIAQGLLAGLHHLGVDATVHLPEKKPSPQTQNPFCATSISWYEMAVNEKKFIGSAQKRWRDTFLQHGSLPLVQSPIAKQCHIETLQSLVDLIPQLPPVSKIYQAIQTGFETALGIRLEQGSLTHEEEQLAKQLAEEKYGCSTWNENRCRLALATTSP